MPKGSQIFLDGETIELLDGTNEFFIQQRVRWGEALTQGCIEQKNIYDVFDKSSNRKIFIIQEESADLNRCCCAPGHSFFAKFYLVDSSGEPRGQAVMTMEREGCDCGSPCPKPCLCCFACKPECADGAVLYAGDLGQNPGELKGQRDQSNMLGATIQPITGGKFKPVVQVMERGDDTSGKPTPQMFAAARGPCFFGGCAEFCCDAEFGISKAKDGMGIDEIHQLAFDYASIKKTRPKNFTQAMREAFTDSDLYDVVFKEQVSAQQKANVLAAMILLEFMFFERDNDMCNYDGENINITLFNCFCYGCICPCTCSAKPGGGDSGGD